MRAKMTSQSVSVDLKRDPLLTWRLFSTGTLHTFNHGNHIIQRIRERMKSPAAYRTSWPRMFHGDPADHDRPTVERERNMLSEPCPNLWVCFNLDSKLFGTSMEAGQACEQSTAFLLKLMTSEHAIQFRERLARKCETEGEMRAHWQFHAKDESELENNLPGSSKLSEMNMERGSSRGVTSVERYETVFH